MNGVVTLHRFDIGMLPGVFFRPQLVQLTFGYRKRNQKKVRRLRRQGVKGV